MRLIVVSASGIVGVIAGTILFNRLIRLPQLPFSIAGPPETVMTGVLAEVEPGDRNLPGIKLTTNDGTTYAIDMSRFSTGTIRRYLNRAVVIRGVGRDGGGYQFVLASWVGSP